MPATEYQCARAVRLNNATPGTRSVRRSTGRRASSRKKIVSASSPIRRETGMETCPKPVFGAARQNARPAKPPHRIVPICETDEVFEDRPPPPWLQSICLVAYPDNVRHAHGLATMATATSFSP